LNFSAFILTADHIFQEFYKNRCVRFEL